MRVGIQTVAGMHGCHQAIGTIEDVIGRFILGKSAESFFLRPGQHRTIMIFLDTEISCRLAIRCREKPNWTAFVVHDFGPNRPGACTSADACDFRSYEEQAVGYLLVIRWYNADWWWLHTDILLGACVSRVR